MHCIATVCNTLWSGKFTRQVAKPNSYNSFYCKLDSRGNCNDETVVKDVCFFCGNAIYKANTIQVSECKHACAVLLKDTEPLAKLSTADMIALQTKYHTKCLVHLHNPARKAKANA